MTLGKFQHTMNSDQEKSQERNLTTSRSDKSYLLPTM
jgi:hypothetical protein